MENQEWLAARRKGIGGSDAAVVCGLSPWKSPFQLYLDKRGEPGGMVEPNEYMRWGTLLEPVIRQRYADVTGWPVAVPDKILVHPKYPWMLANVDGLLPDRVLEVKAARTAQGWGEEGTDEIPQQYVCQVAHYMAVTERALADVAVLIGGSDFRIYTVEKDPELEEMLIEQERVFWERIEKGEPPELTTFEDVTLRFGSKSTAQEVQASPDIHEALQALRELQVQAKDNEEAAKHLKAEIMKHMGEADTLVHGDVVLATWKLDKPGQRFSQKILKEKHPEIYKECLEDKTPARRFLLKK